MKQSLVSPVEVAVWCSNFHWRTSGPGSLKYTCLGGRWSWGGGGAGGSLRMNRDLSELEDVERLWSRPPVNPSPALLAPLWSAVEIPPIQVGISTGVKPPTTWKNDGDYMCADDDSRIWFIASLVRRINVPHMWICCYLSSCGHSWSRRICGYPCPWWRTSSLCGFSWGLVNLRTDAWVEWCSSSPDHLGKICIQWSACPVSSLPAGCEGQSCPERPKSGSSWDPAKTRLWERKHWEVRAGMM